MLIRRARPADSHRVAECIRSLLDELNEFQRLGDLEDAESVCARLVEGKAAGAIYVAEDEATAELAGCMVLSVQEAVRYGGPYVEIQELWVDPERRGEHIGADLVAAAECYCQENRFRAVEVGLPLPDFPNFERTAHFYDRNGFLPVGPCMVKLLRPAPILAAAS